MGKALASILSAMVLVAMCGLPVAAQRGGHGGGGGFRSGGNVRVGGSPGGTHVAIGGRVATGGFRGGIGVGVGGGVRVVPRFPHRAFPPRVVFFSPFVYGYPYYPYYGYNSFYGYPPYSGYPIPSTFAPYNAYDQPPVYVNTAPQQPAVIMMQAPSSTAATPGEPQIILLAFKNHSIYAVTDYSVENGRMTYLTSYGEKNTVDLNQLDFDLSRRLNRERNVPFPINEP